jgi:tRNA threonylcarbamoyladenosine biosynthesis protein TsaB
MILAMETGGDLASLALLDGVDVVAERAFRHRMSLSRDLLPAIDQLLAAAEVPWAAVEAVAVGLGPGSYTGLRIGLVTAKSLAWAADRPVVGISSLAALVAPYPAPVDALLCAVMQARTGEFFAALYQRRDETLQVRAEPTVLTTDELASRLVSYPGPVLLAGHVARFQEQAAAEAESEAAGPESGPSALPRPGSLISGAPAVMTGTVDEEPQARWIGRLAVARLRAGERDHPAALAPAYVRAPSPTLKAEGKEQKAKGGA